MTLFLFEKNPGGTILKRKSAQVEYDLSTLATDAMAVEQIGWRN